MVPWFKQLTLQGSFKEQNMYGSMVEIHCPALEPREFI